MSYKYLQQKDLQNVVERTGCLAPCTFLEYRIIKSVEVVSKTLIIICKSKGRNASTNRANFKHWVKQRGWGF